VTVVSFISSSLTGTVINRIVIKDRQSMPTASDDLSLIFGALADPTRRRIVARLAEGEATVKEIAEPFPISQPAISRHLKVLERAGLIARRRVAQARPTKLRPEALDEADAWIESSRAAWEARAARLDEHLKRRRGKRLDG
jgi:DNA-binding transcriptional ArsR family regulator